MGKKFGEGRGITAEITAVLNFPAPPYIVLRVNQVM
jgi:hypothetical protein